MDERFPVGHYALFQKLAARCERRKIKDKDAGSKLVFILAKEVHGTMRFLNT